MRVTLECEIEIKCFKRRTCCRISFYGGMYETNVFFYARAVRVSIGCGGSSRDRGYGVGETLDCKVLSLCQRASERRWQRRCLFKAPNVSVGYDTEQARITEGPGHGRVSLGCSVTHDLLKAR